MPALLHVSKCLVLILFLGLLLIEGNPPAITAEEPAGYTPVAPPVALNTALQASLKAVRDWVSEKDFESAAETTRGLAALAHLYGYQSADAGWRRRCTALQESVKQLAGAAQRKSMADCEKLAGEVTRLLDDLAKNAPDGDAKTGVKDFKPVGSVKTWMLLMDSAYVDSKSAKSAQEFQQLTQAVAAEANAAAYLRTEQGWRKEALAVRDAALQAAAQAKGNDLAAARLAAKNMRQRCETCHDRTRK